MMFYLNMVFLFFLSSLLLFFISAIVATLLVGIDWFINRNKDIDE